jgi:putative transposase
MRGKVVRSTVSDSKAPCTLDRVNRRFRAERPNQLWVSDFTYVSTWQGWLYVAFGRRVCPPHRRLGGEQLDANRLRFGRLGAGAVRQATRARWQPRLSLGQGFAMRQHPLPRALAEAGIEPSVGRRLYDNPLAETINGLS